VRRARTLPFQKVLEQALVLGSRLGRARRI